MNVTKVQVELLKDVIKNNNIEKLLKYRVAYGDRDVIVSDRQGTVVWIIDREQWFLGDNVASNLNFDTLKRLISDLSGYDDAVYVGTRIAMCGEVAVFEKCNDTQEDNICIKCNPKLLSCFDIKNSRFRVRGYKDPIEVYEDDKLQGLIFPIV